MRYAFLAAAALTAAVVATPASAAKKYSSGLPTWNECYWLGWDRGVHVEQDELDSFMDQCLVGSVPFDNQIGITSEVAAPASNEREITIARRQPRVLRRLPQQQHHEFVD